MGSVQDCSKLPEKLDLHRHEVEFSVGDYVFLKVSSMHGVTRFDIKGKSALTSAVRNH